MIYENLSAEMYLNSDEIQKHRNEKKEKSLKANLRFVHEIFNDNL